LLMNCLVPSSFANKENVQQACEGNGRTVIIRATLSFLFFFSPAVDLFLFFCLPISRVLTGGRTLRQRRADHQVSLYIQPNWIIRISIVLLRPDSEPTEKSTLRLFLLFYHESESNDFSTYVVLNKL